MRMLTISMGLAIARDRGTTKDLGESARRESDDS
jgi:hypothetical protein